MNGITRVYTPITGDPLFGWFRTNGIWTKVRITAAIRIAGCNKSEIELPDGRKIEVASELLRFGVRKPRQ